MRPKDTIMSAQRNITVDSGAVRRIPYQRGHQPKCMTRVAGKKCNHPLSFHPKRVDEHGHETEACAAVGCLCSGWTPSKRDVNKAAVAVA